MSQPWGELSEEEEATGRRARARARARAREQELAAYGPIVRAF